MGVTFTHKSSSTSEFSATPPKLIRLWLHGGRIDCLHVR
jgi:hypothetical protein